MATKNYNQKRNDSVFLSFVSATLASGCCWIQLILNALQLGCAGFSVLTPYKPYFLAATVVFALMNVRKDFSSWVRSAVVLLVMLAVASLDTIIALPSVQRSGWQQLLQSQHAHAHLPEGLSCQSFTVSNVWCAGCFNAAKGVAADVVVPADGETVLASSWQEGTKEAVFQVAVRETRVFDAFKKTLEEASEKRGKSYTLKSLGDC